MEKRFETIISDLYATNSILEQCLKEKTTKSRTRGRSTKKASTASKKDSGIELDESVFKNIKEKLNELRSFQPIIRNSVQFTPSHSINTTNGLSSTLNDQGIPNEYDEYEQSTFVNSFTDVNMQSVSEIRLEKDILPELYKSEMAWLDEFLESAREELVRKVDVVLLPKTPRARTRRVRKTAGRRSSIIDPSTIKKPIGRTTRTSRMQAEAKNTHIADLENRKRKLRSDDSKQNEITTKAVTEKKARKGRPKTVAVKPDDTTISTEAVEAHSHNAIPKEIKKFSALPHVWDKIKAFERFSGSGKKSSDKKKLIASHSTPVQQSTPNAKLRDTKPDCSASTTFNSTASLLLTASKVFKPTHVLQHTPVRKVKLVTPDTVEAQTNGSLKEIESAEDTNVTPTVEKECVEPPTTVKKKSMETERSAATRTSRVLRPATVQPFTSHDFGLSKSQNNGDSRAAANQTCTTKTIDATPIQTMDSVNSEELGALPTEGTVDDQADVGVKTQQASTKGQPICSGSQNTNRAYTFIENPVEMFDAGSSIEELQVVGPNQEKQSSPTHNGPINNHFHNSLESISNISTQELFLRTTIKADQLVSYKSTANSPSDEVYEVEHISQPLSPMENSFPPKKPERTDNFSKLRSDNPGTVGENKTSSTSSNKEIEGSYNQMEQRVMAPSKKPLRVTRSRMRTETLKNTSPEQEQRTTKKTNKRDQRQVDTEENTITDGSDVFVMPPSDILVESRTVTQTEPSKVINKQNSQSSVKDNIDSSRNKMSSASTKTMRKHGSVSSVSSTGSQSVRITRSKMRQPKQPPPPTDDTAASSISHVENVSQKAVKPMTPVRSVRSQSTERTIKSQTGSALRGRSPARKLTVAANDSSAATLTSTKKRKPMPRSNSATETKRMRTSSESSGSKLTNTLIKAASSSRLHSYNTPTTNKTSSFINTILNGKSKTPASTTKTLTSFIKRATPKKQPTQEELVEEKKRNYMVKMEADRARLEQAEKERVQQLEAKKKQRMERMNKAKEARKAHRQEAIKKQKLLEQRKIAAEKIQEEEKAAARDHKMKEQDENRKKEEEDRKAKAKQQEMEAELLRKKHEAEKLAAKRARLEKEAKEAALNKVNEQRVFDNKTPLHNQTKSKISIYTSNTASKQAELNENRSRLISTVNKLVPNNQITNQKPTENLNKTFDQSDEETWENFMDLRDMDMDDEFDDEKFKKYKNANFTQKNKLQMALLSQRYRLQEQPDYRYQVFGHFVNAPDLSSVFKTQKPRFFKRTSSGHWPSPPIKSVKN